MQKPAGRDHGHDAATKRRYPLGAKSVPQSTFADANDERPCTFFEALFSELYTRCLFQASKHKFSFENMLFGLEESVVDLCLTLFPWAKFRTAKGGIKMHTVIGHGGYLPTAVSATEARCHEVNIAKLPKGSIVVFDRGCLDYTWFRQLCTPGVFLVTRLKNNARFRGTERNRTDRTTGVTADQIIQVADGQKASTLRRVGYREQEAGKFLEFLTNHVTLPARTIADIYKERWQIEIFFRFIKQDLKIKSFLGNSKNAVLSKSYVALISYLLLVYHKLMSKIGISLHYL
jgi:putative transposase